MSALAIRSGMKRLGRMKKGLLAFSLILLGALFLSFLAPVATAHASDEPPVDGAPPADPGGGGSPEGDNADQGSPEEGTPAGGSAEDQNSGEGASSGLPGDEQAPGENSPSGGTGDEGVAGDDQGTPEPGGEGSSSGMGGEGAGGESGEPAPGAVAPLGDADGQPDGFYPTFSGLALDAITRQAILNFSVWCTDETYTAGGFNSDELGMYGASLSLSEGSKYTVWATSTGYLDCSWTFIHDGLDGHSLVFFMAPQKKDSEGNYVVDENNDPVPASLTAGWIALDWRVIIDHDICSSGEDIVIRAPSDVDQAIWTGVPFYSITVKEGVTVSSRRLLAEGETDPINGSSGGDSGNIYLASPEIIIEKNARLLAHVEMGSTYSAGNIELEAYQSADYDITDLWLYNEDISKTEIKIQEGAVLRGKEVKLTAKSDNTVIYGTATPDQGVSPESSLSDIEVFAVGFIEDFSLIGAVAISKAFSLITLAADSEIYADTFLAGSYSTAIAKAAPLGIGAGVAVAIVDTEARIEAAGKIITSGDCALISRADNTIQANGTATIAPGGIAAGVAVSILNSKSFVHVTESAVLHIGGNLTVKAETIDRNWTQALSATGQGGKVGVAVALSIEHGETEAYLDGRAEVAGDIVVAALTERKEIAATMIGIPVTRNGVNAAAGVNTGCQNDLASEIKSQIIGKIKGIFLPKIKKLILDKSEEANKKTGSDQSPFEMAAAVAIHSDTNLATARIGDPESTVKAEVKAKGRITILARAESQPFLIAIGTVKESKDEPPAGGEEEDDGTKFAGSAAVAIGLYTNEATAFVGPGAAVDSAGKLEVKAEALSDYEFTYMVELVTIWARRYSSSADGHQVVKRDDIIEVKDGHSAGGEAGHLYRYLGEFSETLDLGKVDFSQATLWEDLGSAWVYRSKEMIRVLTTYLDASFGLADDLVNTWTQSTAKGADVSICGAVTILEIECKAHSYLDRGAKVNQETGDNFRTGNQEVAVESLCVNELINFGGNIQTPGVSGAAADAKSWKPEINFGGPGSGGETAAAGGTVVLIWMENSSRAEVKEGVILYGDNLKVTADNSVLAVTLCAAGGKAGDFGFDGVFSMLEIDNQTLAQIDGGARVVVGNKALSAENWESLLVRASDNTIIINLVGGVAVSENIGVGVAVAVNNLTRHTEAALGALLDSSGGERPGEETWTVISAGPVVIDAVNDGYLISAALASAVSKDKKEAPQDKKTAPQGGGDYGIGVSGEVVLNNIKDTVLAYIRRASLQAAKVIITSRNYTTIIAAGGSVAMVAKKDKTSLGLAGSYAQNTIDNRIRALVIESDLALGGELKVAAEAKEMIISVSASGSGAAGSKGCSVAGQVSVNLISSTVEASILKESAVRAGSIELIAKDSSSILAIAGALAYGGKAGIGAAVAWNEIYQKPAGEGDPTGTNAVLALIQDSDVISRLNIRLEAESANRILAITAAAGASSEEQGLALAATVSMNTISTDTLAYIIGKKDQGLQAGGEVILDASNSSYILAVAGGLSYSQQASIGVAGSYNEISNTVAAYVGAAGTAGETILTAEALRIKARMEGFILNITAGGGAGGKVAVNGSVSINTITNQVSAYIVNSTIDTRTAVTLEAWDRSEIGSIAGAVGGSQENAFGAALAVNYIGSFGGLGQPLQVLCYIEDSRVLVTTGAVSLLAFSEAIIKSISAAGGIGGKNAIFGAVSLNFINTDLAVYIKDCLATAEKERYVRAKGDITLDAVDNSAIGIIAGNFSGSGGTAAVGAAVSIVYIGNGDLSAFNKYLENEEYEKGSEEEEREITEEDYGYDDPRFAETSKVRVYIDHSTVDSGSGRVLLRATSNNAIFNITAGVAIGGKAGVQGSVSVNYIYSNVWAQILNGSQVSAAGDIRVEALSLLREDIPRGALQEGSDRSPVGEFDGSGEDDGACALTSIQSLAGAIAGGGKAGVGIALAINYIAGSYRAGIEGSEVTSENGDIIVLARSEAGIQSISAALAGGGNLGGAGAVSLNFIQNSIIAAITGSTVASRKTDATIHNEIHPGIRVEAKDSSSIWSLCGQINFGGNAGIGAAAGYNTIGNMVHASIYDSQVTSETYTVISALSEALIMTLVAGGGGGAQVSVNGSVAVNSIGNDIAAYIESSQVLGELDIILLASDSSEIGSIAGSVGGAGMVAVGASVAVNYIGTSGNPQRVQAYILNSRVISDRGKIVIAAAGETIIKSISAAGGAAGKVAVYGAVSVNWIYTDIAAFIKDCGDGDGTKLVRAAGDISLQAIDHSAVSVIAGNFAVAGVVGVGAAVGVVFVGSGTLEGGDPAQGNYEVSDAHQESEAKEFDYSQPTFNDDSKVRAFIESSQVESSGGAVKLIAKSNGAVFNISAGAGVGGAVGIQGSVSVNYLHTGVSAYILKATVNADTDILLQALSEERTTIPKGALQVDPAPGENVESFDGGADRDGDQESLKTDPSSPERLTNIQSVAGAVAGGSVGLGAVIAVNHLQNNYLVYLIDSILTAVGDVTLEAQSRAGIETVSAAAAAAGTFAAAGSVSLNFINNTIEVYILSATITAENISLEARDRSAIRSISGQINYSGQVGLGAAAAYNEISNVIRAYVAQYPAKAKPVLNARGNILIRAISDSSINTIAASGSFGANFGGSATVVINLIENRVEAFITDALVTAGGNIYILADSQSLTGSYGGSFGVGAVGAGAAVIVNILNNTTRAYIEGSEVSARGNGAALKVLLWDADGNRVTPDQQVKGLVVIASNKEALTIYSASVGAGLAGASGQVSTNIICNTTEAYINSSKINSDQDQGEWVIVRANQVTGIRIYAGSIDAGGAAVGGAVDATFLTQQTGAYLKDSTIYAGSGVELAAITSLKPLGGSDQPTIVIVGSSLSAMFSLAGAVSVVVTDNQNEAFIQASKVYTLGSIKVFSSHNIDLEVYGGTVSGSGYVGAGGTVVVSSFKNICRAEVIGSELNACESVVIMARSRDKINVKVGTAGIGVTGAGVAGSISVILVETTTEATLRSDPTTGKYSTINQDPRFRPGGSYGPGTAQTISIKADNRSEVNTTSGALGAGAGLGVGAAIDYTGIQNRTVAMVGAGSKLYARGDINLEALSEKIVDSRVYSVGGGLFGISGAVSIICVGQSMDEDSSGEFNEDYHNQLNNDLSPDSRLYYEDDQGNKQNRLPGDDLGNKTKILIDKNKVPELFGNPDLESKITAAFVQNAGNKASRAEIVSGQKVTIQATGKHDLNSKPNNAAAGAAAVGGTVAHIFAAENTRAYLGDYGYLRAGDLSLRAEVLALADAQCLCVAGSAILGVHVYLARADVQPVVEAFIGDRADVVVSNDLQIEALVTPAVTATVKGVTVSGVGEVGESRAEAIVKPKTKAWIGNYAAIVAGSQPISGNPQLTLISRGSLSGTPRLEFISHTIRVEGEFIFERGVVMSGEPELAFDGETSTLTRNDGGSWLDDGFLKNFDIVISGTRENDGAYTIAEISADGKVLTLSGGKLLKDEIAGKNINVGLEGLFTLEKFESSKLTLIWAGGGRSWEELGLLEGDLLTLEIDGEAQNFKISRMDGIHLRLDIGEMDEAQQLFLDRYLGESGSRDFYFVSLEKIARLVSIKAAEKHLANDRVKYVGAAGQSLQGQGLQVGDFLTLLVTDPFGQNSGLYKIIGFEDGGFTAILDTEGRVVSTPAGGTESGEAVIRFSPELCRSEGSWLADGFLPGDIIRVNGTSHNNNYYEIKEISADGKRLVFYKGEYITDENISAGTAVSIVSQGYDRISRDSGSWAEDGFKPGQSITVDGPGQNNGIYRIRAISGDGKHLFLESQGGLKEETSKDIVISIYSSASTISVKAAVLLPVNAGGKPGETARAEAEGISGSAILTGSGVYATADLNTEARAYLGVGVKITVPGTIRIEAPVATRTLAYTDVVNIGGLLDVSVNKAEVKCASSIAALVGAGAVIRGNDLQVIARGDEYGYAEALGGCGGAISGLAAQAATSLNKDPQSSENYGTSAIVGAGAQIDVGSFRLQAEHKHRFNSRVDTLNISLVGGSGAFATNKVFSSVGAQIGDNAVINAYLILVSAVNEAEKDWLNDEAGKDLYNVDSGSGGALVDVPLAGSSTEISFETKVNVGEGAGLNVIGDPFIPGSLILEACNLTLARDRVRLHAGGAIEVADAASKINALLYLAEINIGKNALLKSVGDIILSALARAEIETSAEAKTWGLAGGADGASLSRVEAENRVSVDSGARLFAEGQINLMAGQNSRGETNRLTMKALTHIDNNGVAPAGGTPQAEALIILTSRITIKEGALTQSVSDTNLIAEKGPTIASGKATGRDWVKDVFGAEIKGGSGLLTLDPLVRVDGTVEAGLRSERYLEIDADGRINCSDGITWAWEKAILAEHLLNQINQFKYLAVQYAGTQAGEAFAAQAQFLVQELARMGIDVSGDKPLPQVWIDLIIVSGIKAEQPNINVLAEGGSLIGNGILSACATPAKISIVNHSPHYLVLTDLLIPEREGGLLIYNYAPVLGADLNEVLNLINQVREACFTIRTSGSAGFPASSIYIENTYDDGLNPPAIEIRGNIKNVGTQARPGLVTIKSRGGISCLGSIEAGTLEITAGGSFMQGYIDYQFDVGGSPRALWGELARLIQGEDFPYPADPEIWSFYGDVILGITFYEAYKLVYEEYPYESLQGQINQLISSILSADNPQVGAIRADNIFIAARYLNINGTIEAGGTIQEVTLGGDKLNGKIQAYRVLNSARAGSMTYKDCPLLTSERGFNIYYDPIREAIIVEPLAIRGGYVELFGQIINTGSGKIIALDGFGEIEIDNQTDLDLVIKGLDTGLGMPGTVVITDTAKKKPGSENVYTVTRYRRIYDANTGLYQVEIKSYYSDDPNHLISNSTASGSSAGYQPVLGYRYEWVMGQKVGEEEIRTYRSKDWLGMDWAAKDPDNLYSYVSYTIGTPFPMPEGEYMRYAPEWQNAPYVYYEEHRTSDDWELWGYRNWSEKSWFLGYTWHYEEYTYRKGSIDVFHHSIRADYPIAIEFAGNRSGSINIHSKGDVVLEGPVRNESGHTVLTADGAIYSNTDQPIVSWDLFLVAQQGIGGDLPLPISLGGGSLIAIAYAGDINIRETSGFLNIDQVYASAGNVRLEAKSGMKAVAKDEISIIGKRIELITAYGSIGGDLNGNSALRIDSGEGEGAGLIASARGNINLTEVNGSLQVISVVSQEGDVTLAVPDGSLRNPNYGEYLQNSALLALWEKYMGGQENSPQNIAAFLEEAYRKRIAGTSYREWTPNIVGKNISLSAAGDIGGAAWSTLLLFNGDSVVVNISKELKSLLAAAERGDVVFYNEQGQVVDPAEAFKILIRSIESIGLQAQGRVAISAGGSVYLFADGDLRLDTVSSANGGDVRIKSGGGIFNAADSGAVNIRGGEIYLEASGGPIGAAGKPIIVQQGDSKTLNARSAYDIYLKGVSGTYQEHYCDGSLNLEFIYSPGKVFLESTGDVIDARNDGRENIAAAALEITAFTIGSSDRYLKVDLEQPGPAQSGNLDLEAAGGNIYLEAIRGNLCLGTVKTPYWDVFLRAGDSIFAGTPDPGAANIQAGNINLWAVNGAIGRAEKYLAIATLGSGELSAESGGDIYMIEVSGDLILNTVFSSWGDVYLQSSGSISGVGVKNIICRKAFLLAEGDIDAVGGYLRTAVDYLEARAGSGSIRIRNSRGLIIGGFTDTAGLSAAGEVDLIVFGDLQIQSRIAAGGALTVSVSGRLEVERDITAGGDLLLVTADTAAAGEDILVRAGAVISSEGGSLTLQSGDDLLLEAGSLLAAADRVSLYLDFSAGSPDPGVGSNLELCGEIRAPLLEIYGGDDGDRILIQTACPLLQTVIEAGAGNDVITLDRLGPVLSQYDGQLPTIDLDGQEGSDRYIINLSGESSYIININDTGSGAGDEDILTVNATGGDDRILIRHNFIALINKGLDLDGDGYDDLERINYNVAAGFDPLANGGAGTWLGCTLEQVIINAFEGDDHLILDDTGTCFTINGGGGNDTFQIGQIFHSARDPLAGIAEEDQFPTLETAQGFLSRGISFALAIRGGGGDDQFLVCHNQAPLDLYGEDGDDEFLVRVFAVLGGNGHESGQITNGLLNIEGGAGINTLLLLLSEENDQIVLTEEGIYGGGVLASHADLQRLEIDGMAGDDLFYILSVGPETEVLITGNLGSDTFIIAGEITGPGVVYDGQGNPVILPEASRQTGLIQGKLTLIGGPGEGANRALSDAVTLPAETNRYLPTGTNGSGEGDTFTDEGATFTEAVIGSYLGILDDEGRVVQIRRILALDGSTLILDLPLDPDREGAVKYVILNTSPAHFVDEGTQTDRLLVYNDGSTGDDQGGLDLDQAAGTLSLTGLNMESGIEFRDMEELRIWLGSGNDCFTVHNTAPSLKTEIFGGDGDDKFLLYSCRGDLNINGDGGNDYFDLLFDGSARGDVILNGGRGDDYFNLEFSPEYLEYVILNGDEGDDSFSFADGVVLNGVINGGAGLDTLDYGRYGSARHIFILGWDESGYFGVEESPAGPGCTILDGFNGIRRVIGSLAEGDELYGIPEVGGRWLLDGEKSTYQAEGAFDGEGDPLALNFIYFDYLFGGNGNDSFIMLDGATLSGDIDGGGGQNTLDYRAYTSGVIVNLPAFSATGISGSITGINIVYGGQGDDHLIGDRGNNILASTGGNDILEGGSGNNTYLIYEGFGTVQIIETRQGEDTLDFSNVRSDLIFELVDRIVKKLEEGQVTGSVSYGGRILNLIGGFGNDTFNLNSGQRRLNIESGPGDDIFNLGGNGVLTGNIDSGPGDDIFNFAGSARVLGNIDGGDGDDTFNLSGSAAIQGNTNGGSGNDRFNFSGYGTLNVNIDGGSGDDIFFLTEGATVQGVINGGSGDDTFLFAGRARVTGAIDGGEGKNTLDFSACTASLDLTLSGIGLLNGFNGREGGRLKEFKNISFLIGGESEKGDSLTGLAEGGRFILEVTHEGSDIWNLYQNLIGSRGLSFTGLEVLRGGRGDNTFIIGSAQQYDLYGGAGNDTFIFLDAGRLTSDGHGRYGNLDGGAGNNTLDFSACAGPRDFLLTAPGNTVGFNGRVEGIAGEFRNITGLTGSRAPDDSLSGLNRANVWEIRGANGGIYRAGGRSLAFTSLETLNGGALNDRFRLFDGASFEGRINGGGGSNTLDYSGVSKGIEVNLGAGEAFMIVGSFSAIQNVTGSSGDDLIIGDDGPNILDGGPGNDIILGGGGDDIIYGREGNDELYGEEGNDTLYGGAGDDYLDGGDGDDILNTGGGHNILIGGDGEDKAIVAYRSTYECPHDDIEIWVFLRPFEPDTEEASEFISSDTGGTIEITGGSILIPAGVLPGDALVTIRTLSSGEMLEALSASPGLILSSQVYEITSTGPAYFGENNFIFITLEFDYGKFSPGQSPVVHYFDPETGKWIAVETTISFNEKSGKWEATIKVNHLGIFAVLGTA